MRERICGHPYNLAHREMQMLACQGDLLFIPKFTLPNKRDVIPAFYSAAGFIVKFP